MAPYNEDSFSANFESMSIGTQFRDSSNEGNIYPPYTIRSMNYRQLDEGYGMFNYPPSTQMPSNIPYQMQTELQTNTWEIPEFPIHGEVVGRIQEIYA